jgi:hypothetical protein
MLAVIAMGIAAIASQKAFGHVRGVGCGVDIGDQRLIARGMATQIIQLREVVEIDHRDHQI